MFKVILSSPLGFPGSTIRFETVEFPRDLTGKVSYVGHPTTRDLLEALGARTVTGRWQGPEVGESYLAVPLHRNPRVEGYTAEAAVSSVKELKAVLCTRVA
jgi:hypothetical protein